MAPASSAAATSPAAEGVLAVHVDWMFMRQVADVVSGCLALFGRMRVLFREQDSPMFHDRGRVPVNFHPHQRVVKPMTMCQRTLHARMRVDIP